MCSAQPCVHSSSAVSLTRIRVRRTSVRMHAVWRRSDRDRGGRRNAPATPAVVVVIGCASPQNPRRGRLRRPPWVDLRWGRGQTSTRADRSAHGHPGAVGARMSRVRESGRSSGESSPALGATGLKHGATSASAHPSAKAVLACSAAVVGLVCTLHEFSGRC